MASEPLRTTWQQLGQNGQAMVASQAGRIDRDTMLVCLTENLYGVPWAITREKLAELIAVFESRRGQNVAAPITADSTERDAIRQLRAQTISAELRVVRGMPVQQIGRVAILPMQGMIAQRPGLMTRYYGGTSAEQFAAAHADLVKDAEVGSIIWDIDSPGGTVSGVAEAAERLLSLRGKKRTVAISNTLMASCAYFLGSTADEIVASPSALTGSIGVYAVHECYQMQNTMLGVAVEYITAGKYKAEDNSDTPLSSEARGAMQQMVDDYYEQFVRSVAKARGVSVDAVRTGYGEGRALTAERARAAGLVNRIADLPRLIRQLSA